MQFCATFFTDIATSCDGSSLRHDSHDSHVCPFANMSRLLMSGWPLRSDVRNGSPKYSRAQIMYSCVPEFLILILNFLSRLRRRSRRNTAIDNDLTCRNGSNTI